VMIDRRLVRIDRHSSEYFLFQTMWTLFRKRFLSTDDKIPGGFDTDAVLEAWDYLPPNALDPARNKRSHISHLLARNERERDYAYNRRLFWRIQQGWYQFNPNLSVRRNTAEGEVWQPIFAALNLKLVKEFSQIQHWVFLSNLMETSGLGAPEDKVPMGVRSMLNHPRHKDAVKGTEEPEQQPLAEESPNSQQQ